MWARLWNVCFYVAAAAAVAAVLMSGVVESSSPQCTEKPTIKAEQCSHKGNLSCGVCKCDPGFYGEQCECQPDAWGRNGSLGDSGCKETNNSPVCSGRGECTTCGHCKCYKRENVSEIVDGQYCECTNFQCPRVNGLLCAGQGFCECNRCLCEPKWRGKDCTCQRANHDCINPESGEICSGNGKCKCNRCKCHETEDGRYKGRFCDEHPTCKSNCASFKPCVQCQVFGTGELTPEQCHTQCNYFTATTVHRVMEENEDDRLCTFFDENDCRFWFAYSYDEDNVPLVRVEKYLHCLYGTGSNINGLKYNGAGRNEDSILHVVALMSSVVYVMCEGLYFI